MLVPLSMADRQLRAALQNYLPIVLLFLLTTRLFRAPRNTMLEFFKKFKSVSTDNMECFFVFLF